MRDQQFGGARKPERSAGAFLAGYGMYAMPSSTLSDEIPGEPSELEAERAGPQGPTSSTRRLPGQYARLAALLLVGLIVIWIAYIFLVS
jgi:hypothetical protein